MSAPIQLCKIDSRPERIRALFFKTALSLLIAVVMIASVIAALCFYIGLL